MKVLLDENMAHKLRHALSSFQPVTAQYMGWAGLKNGELLEAAEAAGFDVFVTGDKTVQFEQDMRQRKIAVVSLSASHWRLVKDHIDRIVLAIERAASGPFTKVDCGAFVRMSRRPRGPDLG